MNANDEDEEIVVLEDLPSGFIRPGAEIIDDNDTPQVTALRKRKRESESNLKAPSAKKKTTGVEIHTDIVDTTPGSFQRTETTRSKQTARKSIGGKAPRKQLAAKTQDSP
jgi:hypothetical protein